MNKKVLKWVFPIVAFLLLAPWPVAYGYDAASASSGREPVQITAAEAHAQPTWTAYGHAIGSVQPGELFQINAAGETSDISVTLHLTNTDELIHVYRYLLLEIGIQKQAADGTWHEVTEDNGQPTVATFLTLQNGQVSFRLPGLSVYRLTVDGGSFKCNGALENQSATPRFYLEIDQI